MVAMANLNIPSQFMRRYISSALDVIVHVSRLADGSRKIISLQEITGMEGEVITLQEIFAFEKTGIDAERKVKGKFVCRGVRPMFFEKFIQHGIQVSPEMFDPSRSTEI
jgi:pilus assembly protein CpaF